MSKPEEDPPDQCERCYGERQEPDEIPEWYDNGFIDGWYCGECSSNAEMEL